jgi:hypothetical protein
LGMNAAAPEGRPGGGSVTGSLGVLQKVSQGMRSRWPRRDPTRRRADPAKRGGNYLQKYVVKIRKKVLRHQVWVRLWIRYIFGGCSLPHPHMRYTPPPPKGAPAAVQNDGLLFEEIDGGYGDPVLQNDRQPNRPRRDPARRRADPAKRGGNYL